MNLTMSGQRLEITDALRSYVTSKIERTLRGFEQVVDVQVRLSVDENIKEKNRRQKAECHVHVKGGDLIAESTHEDLYAAIDEMVDKLDRQKVRYKDKRLAHDHASVRDVAPQ